jgi:HEAT repeat protein/energy-coupling factor transporter ATP-binding protein EcfA2
MSSTPAPFRRAHQALALDDQLARLAEGLRLARNGGFLLLSYAAADDAEGWFAALESRLGDVCLERLRLPSDGIGLMPLIAEASQSSELARHDLGVLVVAGVESLAPAALTRLAENLNLMRNRLAQVAYPILFCAAGQTLDWLVRDAPDLFDRIGLWVDLREHRPPPIVSPAHTFSPRERYIETLIRQLRLVEFRGILSINKPVALPLTDFYVPFKATEALKSHSLPGDSALFGFAAAAGGTNPKDRSVASYHSAFEREQFARQRRETRLVPIAEVLAQQPSVVVLGDPGAGKSTLLRALALAAAEDDPQRMGLPERSTGWLPLLVPCTAYAQWLRDAPEIDPLSVVLDYLAAQYAIDGLGETLRTALDEGGALLLFDGLDEILEATQRNEIARAIDSLLRTALPQGNRAIITSRSVGYAANALALADTVVTLRDFDNEQVALFLRSWCAAFERFARGDSPEAQADGERQAAELVAEIESNAGVRRLAGNPLLLTIMALIQRQGVKMPQRRVELYDIAARTLIESWNRARSLSGTALHTLPDPRLVSALLAEVALWMQRNAAAGTASAADLLPVLVEAHQRRDIPEPEQAAAAFLRDVQEHSGLLIERGPDSYSFLHLTFQEYFAARALAAISDPNKRWAQIEPHLYDPRWRETILLTCGELGIRIGREDEVSDLVQRIRGKPLRPPWAEEHPLAKFWWRCQVALLPYLPQRARDHIEERLLQRRLLLAGRVLADDVGVSIQVARPIVGDLIKLSFSPNRGQYLASNAIACAMPIIYCEAFIDKFLQLLTHDDEGARLDVILSLNCVPLESPKVLKSLINALSDTAESVRSCSALVLSGVKHNKDEVVAALLQTFPDKSQEVRYSIVLALGEIGRNNPIVVDTLIQALKDTSEKVIAGAANVLGKVDQKKPIVLTALITALRDSSSQNVMSSIMSALKQIGPGDVEVVERLFEELRSNEDESCQDAALALGLIGKHHPMTAKYLLETFKHPNIRVKQCVLLALGTLEEEESAILNVLLDNIVDDEKDLRYSAAFALGFMSDNNNSVIPALLIAVNDLDSSVRSSAVTALGRLKSQDPKVISILLKALQDNDEEVRSKAAIALSLVGKGRLEVIEALKTALKDAKQMVRDSAAVALVHNKPHSVDTRCSLIQWLNTNISTKHEIVYLALAGEELPNEGND